MTVINKNKRRKLEEVKNSNATDDFMTMPERMSRLCHSLLHVLNVARERWHTTQGQFVMEPRPPEASSESLRGTFIYDGQRSFRYAYR